MYTLHSKLHVTRRHFVCSFGEVLIKTSNTVGTACHTLFATVTLDVVQSLVEVGGPVYTEVCLNQIHFFRRYKIQLVTTY